MKNIKVIRLILLVLIVVGSVFVPIANLKAQKKKASQLQQLKLFRSEFVEITPGEGRFPKTLRVSLVKEIENDNSNSVQVFEFNDSFFVCKFEVYQNLYEAVMGTNPSRWKGVRNSAEQMTFAEAQMFCENVTKLMRAEKLISTDQVVRLPTELEWEYFARAGTTTQFSFGEEAQAAGDVAPKASILDEYAWHTGNAAGNDPAVGVLKPNPWGLYDVHGYLWEFCADDWDTDRKPTSVSTPVKNDSKQVSIRGGSWKDPFPHLASGYRRPFSKNGRDDAVGFRCVIAKTKTEK